MATAPSLSLLYPSFSLGYFRVSLGYFSLPPQELSFRCTTSPLTGRREVLASEVSLGVADFLAAAFPFCCLGWGMTSLANLIVDNLDTAAFVMRKLLNWLAWLLGMLWLLGMRSPATQSAGEVFTYLLNNPLPDNAHFLLAQLLSYPLHPFSFSISVSDTVLYNCTIIQFLSHLS